MIVTIAPELIIPFLTASWKCRHFPRSAKRATAVLFHKKDKDPLLVISYCVIYLLPALGKLLERVILGRLTFFLHRNRSMELSQSGFRGGMSTKHTISNFLQIV
ncbi:RNA-directed DNA polymerase from mobile element jockey, partial [Stegodyphus mimosarum]